MHHLDLCVRHGRWTLVEDLPETGDSSLEPLLLNQRYWYGGTEVVNLGDQVVPYNRNFKLFLATRLANPHFPPELCAKVSVLNFAVTPEGLLDQMLGTFIVRVPKRLYGLFLGSVMLWRFGVVIGCGDA
jgi:dynein heavy chain, axonemal